MEIPYSKNLEEPNVWEGICSVLKAIVGITIVWHPILISLFLFIDNLTMFRYPVIESWILLLGLFFLLPSITALAISKIKFRFKKAVFVLLFILCILCNGFNILTFGLSITESRTTDPDNYRKIDYAYPVDENGIYEELFPASIPTSEDDADTVYYYRYLHIFSPIYDIYAEWDLEGDEYTKEIDRVTELFENVGKDSRNGYKFTSLKKGDYDCLILHKGGEPFRKTEGIYTYLIFAYNNESKTVRYFYCDSCDSGVDQPYYLKVDW